MTPHFSEAILEKAAALSQRPSHYAGWEIGSTAPATPAVGNTPAPLRLALIWSQPYERAMNDPLLLGVYSGLSREGVFVERIFPAAGDFIAAVESLTGRKPWFSLESKLPLDAFDAYVMDAVADSSPQGQEVRRMAVARERPIFACSAQDGVDAAGAALRVVAWAKGALGGDLNRRPFGLTGPAPSGPLPLMAYRSSEDQRFLAGIFSSRTDRGFSFSSSRLGAYRVRVSRGGWSRFVSHLEQIQIFKSAVLLAGLPAAFGGERKPRLKMSFGTAVSVGWCSKAEFFDLILNGFMEIEEIRARLAGVMPAGYEVGDIRRIPLHFPSLEDSANVAEYWLEAADGAPAIDWEQFQAWFKKLSAGEISAVVRKEKSGQKVDMVNLAEIVRRLTITAKSQTGAPFWGVRLELRFAPHKNLKPEKVLEAGLGLTPEAAKTDIRISRVALGLETPSGKVRYL